MAEFRYTARVLPDGHLPIPSDLGAGAGTEFDVTLNSPRSENGEADARRRSEYLLHRWAGVGRGSGSGVAGNHDEHLYGR